MVDCSRRCRRSCRRCCEEAASGLRVQGMGFRMVSGCRVQGIGFMVSGFKVWGF